MRSNHLTPAQWTVVGLVLFLLIAIGVNAPAAGAEQRLIVVSRDGATTYIIDAATNPPIAYRGATLTVRVDREVIARDGFER